MIFVRNTVFWLLHAAALAFLLMLVLFIVFMLSTPQYALFAKAFAVFLLLLLAFLFVSSKGFYVSAVDVSGKIIVLHYFIQECKLLTGVKRMALTPSKYVGLYIEHSGGKTVIPFVFFFANNNELLKSLEQATGVKVHWWNGKNYFG